MVELRDYQETEVDAAVEFALNSPGRRRLASAPCGTGKGTIQLEIQRKLTTLSLDTWILTPSLEVIRGLLERQGLDYSIKAAEQQKITTTTRFTNRLLSGEYFSPDVVIADECHHNIEEGVVTGTIAKTCPDMTWLGYTATPYRGTPLGTHRLHEFWGNPVEILNLGRAAKRRFLSLPLFEIKPVFDDDQIKVVGGEFQAKSASKAFGACAETLARAIDKRGLDRPTAVSVPTSDAAQMLCNALKMPAIWIHAKTPQNERGEAYEMARRCEAALISIRVISEGVDMPWLARLWDARPTMSAVAWMQQLGRIMRPKEERPEYICVCRNLERHSYLVHDVMPRSTSIKAQLAFDAPTRRGLVRAIGLKGLGRYKQIRVPLDGGGFASMQCIFTMSERAEKRLYISASVPWLAEPFVATRVKPGKWHRCKMPVDLVGYQTERTYPLTVKQNQWWQRSAKRCGLDPDAEIDARQFQLLPALAQTKTNILLGRAK